MQTAKKYRADAKMVYKKIRIFAENPVNEPDTLMKIDGQTNEDKTYMHR